MGFVRGRHPLRGGLGESPKAHRGWAGGKDGDEMIEHLEESLNPSLWLDGDHLDREERRRRL